MRSTECVDIDCALNRDGTCSWAKARDGYADMRCAYGRFATTVTRDLDEWGRWTVRQYKDGAVVARLKAPRGRVEVWGGRHANEVWAIERGGDERMVCGTWQRCDPAHESDFLASVVALACAMVGLLRTDTSAAEAKVD